MFFKFSVTVVVLLCFVSLAFSGISRTRPQVHPAHPRKCWDSATRKAYDVGTEFTIPPCTRVSCLNDFSFEYATCGQVQTSPPCYVTKGYPGRPYPRCCPDVKCK